jgi:hypothetical protein
MSSFPLSDADESGRDTKLLFSGNPAASGEAAAIEAEHVPAGRLLLHLDGIQHPASAQP